MINVFDFYMANQSTLNFSTDSNVWPAQVLNYILTSLPNESQLYFPKGTYSFNSPSSIFIQRTVTISGSGQETIFKQNTSFYITHPKVMFENLYIERYASSTLGTFTVYAPYVSIRNVNFLNKAAINAPAIYFNDSAENWYLEYLDIKGFQFGIKNEANYGTCLNVNAFEGHHGIEDRCLSGSTYIACNTYGNVTLGFQCLHKSTFTGCNATDRVNLLNDSLWVGGNLDYNELSSSTSGTIFTKTAFKQFGNNGKGMHFKNNDNTTDAADFYAGGGNNAILEFPSKSDGTGNRWQLKFGSAPEDVTYNLGLVGETPALSFTGGNKDYITPKPNQFTPFMKPGKLGLPRGYYIGYLSNFIFVTSSLSKPNNLSGRQGDRVMNRSPKVKPITQPIALDENYMGWICVQSKTDTQSADWKGFGLLEE